MPLSTIALAVERTWLSVHKSVPHLPAGARTHARRAPGSRTHVPRALGLRGAEYAGRGTRRRRVRRWRRNAPHAALVSAATSAECRVLRGAPRIPCARSPPWPRPASPHGSSDLHRVRATPLGRETPPRPSRAGPLTETKCRLGSNRHFNVSVNVVRTRLPETTKRTDCAPRLPPQEGLQAVAVVVRARAARA